MIVDNRTLIITDPGYISLDNDWGNGFNFENLTISVPEITDYIWVPTGFGDGTGTVFTSDKSSSQYELEEIIINLRKDPEDVKDFVNLGEFGVDSGTFGVFFYDEILKYNPNFSMEIGSWCYTIVPHFSGVIYDTAIDDSDEDSDSEYSYCYNYLIGSGNKSICTIW